MGTKFALNPITGKLDLIQNITPIFTAMHDPTGFENRTGSAFTFTDATRKLEITVVSGSYNIWFAGVKHIISTTKEIAITDVEGLHYIYFDTDDTLKEYVNATVGEILTLIRDKCLVSIVYWDATNKVGVYVGEERHGCIMDGQTHYYLHYTRGLQYISGLGLGDFSINTGVAASVIDADAQFSVAEGTIADEDIGLTVSAIGATTGLPILYRSGATGEWRTVTQAGFSVYANPAGTTNRLMYNQFTGGAWQLTEVDEADFVLYHIFATTGKVKQMYSIMGQAQYTTATLARLAAQDEISSLLLGDLPTPEIRPIATVIFETDKDFPNTVHARVVEYVSGGDDYIDWRTNDLPRGVTPADHGSLTGLSDDDHTQYILADGTRAITQLKIDDAATYIDKDGSGNMTFTDAVVGTKTLKELGCPTLVKLSATGQSAGSLNLTDANWAVSKAWLKRLTVTLESGTSSDFDIEIYEKDTFLEADRIYRLETNDDDVDVILDYLYEDLDASDELHIKITDNDGTGSPVFGIKVKGIELI